MEEMSISEKEDELVGGIKNALSRGESLEIAINSFLSAGYSPQLVSLAARKISGQNIQRVQTVSEHPIPKRLSLPLPSNRLYASRPVGNYPQQRQYYPIQTYNQQNTQTFSKTKSRKFVPYWAIILMIMISLLILIGASVLGLYWNQIFGI